jgi:hypothetical protein
MSIPTGGSPITVEQSFRVSSTERFNGEVVRLRNIDTDELLTIAADELRVADDRNRSIERRALALVLVERAGGGR